MLKVYSKVLRASGVYLEAYNIGASVGDRVVIEKEDGGFLEGEVVGFNQDRCIIMPFGSLMGVSYKDKVLLDRKKVSTAVGKELLGRVVDFMGRDILTGKRLSTEERPIELQSINPLHRERIREVFDTGIRSINALLTLGVGQKVGIFAGAGVGKTTLLGMITSHATADVVVLSLVGERGREVREFVEDVLGDAINRSLVVVSTAEDPPIVKVKSAVSAVVHARYFAQKGYRVLLVMDSMTRLAQAQREIGLAVGEPPTLKGFTPSVFYLMSKVVESCGNFREGSITGIFSVLVEGDDVSLDPVADALMGMMDGHIILSRKRANASIYPAIDPVKSLSRIMPQLVSKEHMKMATAIREVLSLYESMEDLINMGLYTPGSNPILDRFMQNRQIVDDFFRQSVDERVSFEESVRALERLYSSLLG
ncbi:FliI/YscN family ATPase [Thermocrinis minervae]|uniref:Flagellum-specific ATP synthase n=1 Tax=Thermocrinis minervae TaxID=381751 RepID=A0A1M6QWE6_9AQUI|nr:FliI/YscN family ATPase [Thermocrinis minervae]SHK24551.1 flagellum-specific ATP synthase [Thermocrinis minervae]